MRQHHSFVVRIYRRDAETVAGLVEQVETGRAAAFHSLKDLCDLLGGQRAFPRRRARRRAAPPAVATRPL
jgi:hypothetical protein